MASRGIQGFFATHLHSILDLPLTEEAKSNMINKRMETTMGDSWTYKMVDGVCTDSQALKTAAKFGIPRNVIERAEALSVHINSSANISGKASPTKQIKFKTNLCRNDHLERAPIILNELSGKEAVRIEPYWSSPPAMEGVSVVYVIVVKDSFYIGETDSLSKRIRQHRSKRGWEDSIIFAVRVDGGKSNARNLESLLIRRFVSENLPLISTNDGKTISTRRRQQY